MRENTERPRIGVPWRTTREEVVNNRRIIDKYLEAIDRAGGDPVLVSLNSSPDELTRISSELDAYVLTGSPADVNPEVYRAPRNSATAQPDDNRERTDFLLIEHALASAKPLLAICYGIQTLNTFLGGTLVQDIPSEIPHALVHSPPDELPGEAKSPEVFHGVEFEAGVVRDLAGTQYAQVNSSHHQSVLEPGRGLRITGHASDGVVEAVEWTGDANWIVGIQWHPERLPNDALAQALFREIVAAARRMPTAKK